MLPQVIRRNKPELSKAQLRRQTRSLLGFSLLHGYPVWGTKLMRSEYNKLLQQIDRFGGLAGAKREWSGTLDDMSVVSYTKNNGDRLLVVVNTGHTGKPLQEVIDILLPLYGGSTVFVTGPDETISHRDFALYGLGDWTK